MNKFMQDNTIKYFTIIIMLSLRHRNLTSDMEQIVINKIKSLAPYSKKTGISI